MNARPSSPPVSEPGPQLRDPAHLRARRRQARRRRHLARVDVGIAVAVALVLLLITPGLAMAAIVALLVLIACAVSFVLSRRREGARRPRGRVRPAAVRRTSAPPRRRPREL